MPLFILALGAGVVLFATEDLVSASVVMLAFAVLAGVHYVKDARTERYLVLDATRRLLVVHRGHRMLVEIRFDDIDAIFVETSDDANATADAVAKLTGIVREREMRRRKPET